MNKRNRTEQKCECGAPLPMHLFEIADERFSHTCSCGAVWRLVKGEPAKVGYGYNPFA